MAGIGFELRRLYRQDNLSGLMQAYLHAGLAVAGPWLFTVMALGAIMTLTSRVLGMEMLANFKSIVIYNFCFSLVLAGPLTMIMTRYLSDRIYDRDVSTAPGNMLGSIILFVGIGLPLATGFYFGFARISPFMAFAATVNFLLIGITWLLCVFLSALKDYRTVSTAFLAGMLVAIVASAVLANFYGAEGLMIGFNLGLTVIVAGLVACIYAEYPYPLTAPFVFMSYFRKHWDIALVGLLYNSAIWIDKWVMWGAHGAQKLSNRLVMFPHYDSAMFLAYLTILPAAALFLFYVETGFFERYLSFYRDIQRKATFSKIERNHQTMMAGMQSHFVQLFLLQACISGVTILAAPVVIGSLHGDYLQIGIFRFGVLGAMFHVLTMFLMIFMSYFNRHRETLLLAGFFLLSNGLLTWMSVHLGFAFYGYGYFGASLLTFVLAAVLTLQHVRQLPYHTFITSNSAVTG